MWRLKLSMRIFLSSLCMCIFKNTYNALLKAVKYHFPLKITWKLIIYSHQYIFIREDRLIGKRICHKKHCDKMRVFLYVYVCMYTYMSCTYIKGKMFSNACKIMKQLVSSLSNVIKRANHENTSVKKRNMNNY